MSTSLHMGAGVLILAAGRGDRLGGTAKQFRRLGGRMVLERALDAFHACDEVDVIVVAAPGSDCERLTRQLREAGFGKVVSVTPGGRTRAESVRNALAVTPQAADPVLVHDAARPFVSTSLVASVVGSARRYGAVAPAIGVTDTLRRSGGACFGEAVSRDGLLRMQTPQGFRRSILEQALSVAGDDFSATDDVELVQLTGHEVRIVDGSATNMKITTAEDWNIARALWKTLETEEGA